MNLIIIVLSFILLNFSNVTYSQNSDHNNLFSKIWIYPNTPDSLIKPLMLESEINESCLLLPPDSLRVFGNIRGMGCDMNDNFYVWDDGYFALWKFSPEGKKLWRKKYKKGNNDAEFNNVGPAFAVSKNGKIYLGDKGNKIISILDSNGNFINKFKVQMWPATITIGNDESIYVAGFPMSYKGNLIQHYEASGKLINTFCERKNMSKEIIFSGNSGRLSTDKEGNIYYAQFYPYQIEKFSPSGELLKTIENKEDDFVAPQMSGGMVDWTSGLRGLENILSDYWAVIVYLNKNSGNWRMDFYNSDNIWKKFLSNKDLPFNFSYRSSAVDSKGNLYFDVYTKQEPVVIKYKIDYSSF